MSVVHVDGIDKGKVMLYTLSTCVWCKRTKALLKDIGVAYDYIDVDLLSSDEEEAVMKEIMKFNPSCNFPTMVINDKKCIVGFKEDEIREALQS
jgi:glutaredoxin-like protein NrdH